MKCDLLQMNLKEGYIAPSGVHDLAAEVLQWYRPDCVFVREFQYYGGNLRATVIPRALDYGIIDMQYLTATQFTLVLSQMAYVLTACLCLDPSIEKLQVRNYETLLENIPSGKCLLTSQNWVFRKMISKDRTSQATLTSERVKILHKRLILRCGLNIGDGAVFGESNFLMPL
ncbi:MAG: hypothetical protein KAV87_25640 [Desulfobacteraceae bacterium]|nr:hypothetical protein [Desulfobacteraceae bacterium]